MWVMTDYLCVYTHDCQLFVWQFGVGEERYIATKIAHAVQYMHHHDPVVIHQDIKPQNVLVSLLICQLQCI